MKHPWILVICFMMTIFNPVKPTTNMKDTILDNKQQSIIAIASLEAKGDLTNLSTAINEGLDNGLTVNQIKEILSQLYAYTGFPRSLNALGTLQKVIDERAKAGKKTEEGKSSSPRPKDFDALKEGTRIQTLLRGGVPLDYSFCPAEDYYLKAHLFGDIFSGDIVTYAEREIATISALSALESVAPQLASHVKGARNMGVSDEEIRHIPVILSEKTGEKEAWRAKEAIAQVYNSPLTEQKPMTDMSFPKGKPNTAYAKYFIGNSYIQSLVEGKTPVSNVTFEPGCRNNWHIHHAYRQILICVGGEGWYQEWGKPARKLKAGDVVEIPAEAKHWHGATRNSWFQHIVLHVDEGTNPSNEWLEPVNDEHYMAL